MNETDLVALKASIEKWERRAAGVHEGTLGAKACPLCNIYNNKPNLYDNCVGCPVFKKTGLRYCSGTPYNKYYAERTVAHAKEEVAFLKSLLPAVTAPAKEEFEWKDLDYLEKKEKDLWT